MKIRQEINLICPDYSASNAVITPNGRAYLNADDYPNATFYLEITASTTAGSTGSIRFRDITGTPSDISTFDISSIGPSALPYRFLITGMPSGEKMYGISIDAAGSGKTFYLKHARIVVLQEAEVITNTVTYIEIGSEESQASTTDVALTQIKYWKYEQENWSTSTDFKVDLIFKRDSNMSSSSWSIEYSTDLISWSTYIAIISNSTATTISRAVIRFDPTNGHYYRLVSKDSNTMNGSHTTYNCKIYGYTRNYKLVESINNDPQTNSIIYGGTGTFEATAQNFTPQTSYYVNVVRALAYTFGVASDAIYAELRMGSITGVTTLLGTSSNVQTAGGFLSSDRNWVSFVFPETILLEAGTIYCVVFQRTGARSTSNHFYVSRSTADNYSGTGEGFSAASRDNGVWTLLAGSPDLNVSLWYTDISCHVEKFEGQYLISTQGGLGNSIGYSYYFNIYKETDWNAKGGTITYVFQAEGVNSGTASMHLERSPDNYRTHVPGSTLTAIGRIQLSSNLELPHRIDTYSIGPETTATGTVYCARILVRFNAKRRRVFTS